MKTAAILALLGCGTLAWRFMTSADDDERIGLAGLASAGLDLLQQAQKAQAIEVVNAYAKAQRRSR